MTAAAFDILLILPLMLAGYSVACDLMLPAEALQGPLGCLIPLGICALCVSFKHIKNRGRMIMSGVLFAALLTFFLSLPKGERIETLPGYMPYVKLILICAVCYVTGEIFNCFTKLRAAASLLFAAALPIALVNGYSAGKLCVCSLLIWLLFNITDLVQRYSKKEGDTEERRHLVFISPFLIAAFVVFGILPVPEKPYDWALAKRIGSLIANAVEDISEDLFKNRESEEAFIGFSGRGELNGKLNKRNRVELELHTTMGYDDNLYLAGRVFRDFTDAVWVEDEDAGNTDERFDAVETMCAVMREDEDGKLNDALMKVYISVKYRDIRNRSIFAPAKTYVKNGPTDTEPDRYKLMYYRLNGRYEKYGEVMEGVKEISRTEWEAALKELGLERDESLNYEAYLAYKSGIKEKYLPDTPVSDRLKSYLDSELEECGSDHECALKLSALLADGVYTNEPGGLPEEIRTAADYLDYFMFENKAGYCSHYASAYVLMARSRGIPARFVQGFKTKIGRKSDTEVKAESAHAWPEVYLEGRGWTVIEPTPGYAKVSGWKVAAEKERSAVADGSIDDADVRQGEEEQNRNTEEKEAERVSLHAERIFIPILSGAGLALLLYLADLLLRKKRYQKLNEREKCLYLCRQYLAMFKRIRLERDEEETLGEFRQRALPAVNEEQLVFLDTYERLLYAKLQPDAALRERLEKMKKPLQAYIRKKKKEMQQDEYTEEDA
ncbi:MAG: transglutaminase domain-containing protein [Lachnospiraceae bacterium]|nr:transglutaminase domain-containing protein [Lachnospiraceae bacterium]